MAKEIIRAEHIGMKFNLSKEKVDSLKEYVIKSIKRQMEYNEFWALKDISFTLEKGDRLGILGLNGAGKSTLLKVIAGVFKPTEGKVYKKGKIAPLLELGAGFDMQYTGAENIYLYGAVLGYSKKFIDEKFDEQQNSILDELNKVKVAYEKAVNIQNRQIATLDNKISSFNNYEVIATINSIYKELYGMSERFR